MNHSFWTYVTILGDFQKVLPYMEHTVLAGNVFDVTILLTAGVADVLTP